MRLGFEAKRLFCNYTGLGNYARTLVSNLMTLFPEEEYLLFSPKVLRNGRTENYFQNPRVRIVSREGMGGGLWRLWGMGATAGRENVSLFHGLSNELPEDVTRSRAPSVVSIHDLIFRHFPLQFGLANAAIYEWKFRSACRRADVVVAISEATRADVEAFYGVPRERIRVVPQGCDPAFSVAASTERIAEVRRKYALPSEYVLSVGSVIERKNLLGVVKALRGVPHAVPLVVVGDGGAYKDRVKRFVAEHGLSDRVHFLSQVAFADLPVVYQAASCFVYVSFLEGFGIPVLEALCSRTPVVTSHCSSMPEAAGPGALLVDPADPEAIGAAITRLLEDDDLRRRLVERGISHSERFRPERVTGEMMDVYKSLVK